MPNAVIYARYSSDTQREESIEGQIRECREYARHQGFKVIDTYIDRACSARTDDRPDFQRMIKDSSKRHFEIVLVWKLDRFARNRYDSARYKQVLKKNGVKVVSVKEYISDGAEGIFIESSLETLAEYYSLNLSENIRRGQDENALHGKFNGGNIPLGYVLGDEQRLQIDPLTAPVVLEIFQRYADGETTREIIESLNARGLKTSLNKPFSMNSFNRLLKNRKYIGEYRYREHVIPGGVPAIVPEELFQKVQERLEKNKRAPARAKAETEYLLTTKLFCGTCGRMMVGESGVSHTGQVYYYYKCGSAKRNKGCKKKAVRKDWIENEVIRLIRQYVLTDKEINRIAKEVVDYQKQENTTLDLLLRKKADVEKSLSNLLKALEAGIISATIQKRLTELEDEKSEIEISIAKEELRTKKLDETQVLNFLHRFKDGDANDINYRRQLIDCFVNRIYLFDDRMVLTFNTDSDTREISFDLVKGSDMTNGAPPSKKVWKIRTFFYFPRTILKPCTARFLTRKLTRGR